MAVHGAVPPSLLTYALGFLAIAVAFHLVLRWRAPYADPLLLPIVTLLNGLGLVMIYRLDLAHGRSFRPGLRLPPAACGAPSPVAIAAAVSSSCATTGSCAATRTPPGWSASACSSCRSFRSSASSSTARASGSASAGSPSSRARSRRSSSRSSSPATSSRPATPSRWPGARSSGWPCPGPAISARSSWPGCSASAVLVFESDLGTSLLFFGLFVAMLYVATERVSWIAIGLVLFSVGAYAAYLLFGHVQERVLLWLHTFSPAGPPRVQPARRRAHGHGGRRDGGHRPRSGPPRPHPVRRVRLHRPELRRGDRDDRAVRPARSSTPSSSSAGCGRRSAPGTASASCSPRAWRSRSALQCFVVVGGVTRVIPLTGLTMPFLSSGGSSLLANWTLVAILLRISDHARRPVPGPGRPEPDGRGQDRGGEDAVNAPIRRISTFVAVLFVVPARVDDVHPVRRRPSRSTPAPTTAAPCCRPTRSERGQILVGDTADREVGARPRPVQVAAGLPAGQLSTRTSPATTPSSAPPAVSRRPTRPSWPARATSCSTAGCPTCSPAASRRARASS